MKLANNVVVTTGGNSDVGLATAQEFKVDGASIAIFRRTANAVGPRLG